MQDTHSATNSVDNNQLKCWFDQQVQLKQLRLVNLTEHDPRYTFKLLVSCYMSGFAMDSQLVKTMNESID